MNYLKVYCNLIRKAENRTSPEGYVEKHHIFPKSIFGKNNRVIILTGREHYIAHLLLQKICEKRYGIRHRSTQKMLCAHINMKSKGRYCNSYLYENARVKRSESMRKTCEEYGLDHRTMNKIIKGQRKSHKGWTCKEVKELSI
jgi:hypothetical protein